MQWSVSAVHAVEWGYARIMKGPLDAECRGLITAFFKRWNQQQGSVYEIV